VPAKRYGQDGMFQVEPIIPAASPAEHFSMHRPLLASCHIRSKTKSQ
jgi:hypothetical protein